MLGIIADLLAAVITILFPVFASYKALKVSDPAQLAPWCIYWVVLSLFLLLESWTIFILGWFPFYSWIRLGLLSYLVLPQTQGAKLLYFSYIAPFIENHEQDIENFISDAHERAVSAGLTYVKKLIEVIREKLLGLPPPSAQQAPPPQPQSYGTSYAADLLSRFSIPSARVPAAPSTADIYSLLSSAISSATTPKTPTSTSKAAATSTAEKLSFLASQRERLTQLLTAVDREQSTLAHEKAIEADVDARMNLLEPSALPPDPLGLGRRNRNKSEHSFENIEREDVAEDASPDASTKKPGETKASPKPKTDASGSGAVGGWLPTSWWTGSTSPSMTSSKPNTQSKPATTKEVPATSQDGSHGQSSGFEAGK